MTTVNANSQITTVQTVTGNISPINNGIVNIDIGENNSLSTREQESEEVKKAIFNQWKSTFIDDHVEESYKQLAGESVSVVYMQFLLLPGMCRSCCTKPSIIHLCIIALFCLPAFWFVHCPR